jgi:hypothetical protein
MLRAVQPKLTCHICVAAKLISAAAVIKGPASWPYLQGNGDLNHRITASNPEHILSNLHSTQHSTAQHSTEQHKAHSTACQCW